MLILHEQRVNQAYYTECQACPYYGPIVNYGPLYSTGPLPANGVFLLSLLNSIYLFKKSLAILLVELNATVKNSSEAQNLSKFKPGPPAVDVPECRENYDEIWGAFLLLVPINEVFDDMFPLGMRPAEIIEVTVLKAYHW